MRALIVTVCGDPGGARAIAPVIKLLAEDHKVTLINYAYNQAIDILKHYNIEPISLLVNPNDDVILRSLQKDKATLVLTATSLNEKNWELLFIAAAQKLNIFSMSILDFWSNYSARFMGTDGNPHFPEKIAVMDEHAKTEMIAEGVPAECIIITGQPALDDLLECREGFTIEKKSIIRTGLGVKDEGLLIIFASQPFRKLYGSQDNPKYLGYDEHVVLKEVIHSLEIISRKYNKNITLLIRPHPRELLTDYKDYHSDQIHIIVSMEGDNRACAMAADLVLGMTTILLLEACYLNCVVLSLQPELRQMDTLPTNAQGVSIPVYQKQDIASTLEKYLLDSTLRQTALMKTKLLQIKEKAARRVVKKIMEHVE